MSLSTLINRPCTILRRSDGDEIDEFGNPVPVETVVETVCELQQRARNEPAAAGELSQTLWDAFFLAGEVFTTADALVVDGAVYEATGDSWTVRNPLTQTDSHVEATVRRTASEGTGS